MKKHIFKRLSLLVFFVFILNTLGSFFSWYILLPWYDNMMHFLGGAWLGLVALWAWYDDMCNRTKGTKEVFLFTLCGAILWEILEYFLQANIAGVPGLFATPTDSVSDIVFGLAGGVLMALHYLRKMRI